MPRRGRASFDAFIKVPQTIKNPTSLGGFFTILVSVLLVYLSIHNLNQYLTPRQSYEFLVDQSRPAAHSLAINIDLTVAMPCKHLLVNMLDSTGEAVALTQSFLKKETTWSSVGYAHMEDRGEDSVVEREISRVNDVKGIASCNIHGSVYVNRVMGLFHITAGGHGLFVLYITPGYYGPHTPHDLLNFTHRIDELSFGKRYPGMINPLDKSYEFTDKSFSTLKYAINIVPTTYLDLNHWNPLASLIGAFTLQTNQYAVTEYRTEVDTENQGNTPGIFFKYEIEPIGVRVTEEKQSSLIRFVVRMCAILGGIFVSVGIFHDFVVFTGTQTGIIHTKKAD